MKEPFEIAIPEADLVDLRERLGRTRWPDDPGNEDWRYGTNLAYLRELCEYWRTAYDWRKQEREINRFRQYRVNLDGQTIHFIHEPGRGPKPIPLILTHGWPWTFWDFHKMIGPLTDPAAFGGDPADAFDVVVPSLPGYGFSIPLARTGISIRETSRMWLSLMRDVLGYDRFAAGGGDWGAVVSQDLGHAFSEHLIGLHLSVAIAFERVLPIESDYAPEEKVWYEKMQRHFAVGRSHGPVQATKPQALAYGMNDSPAGLCAWIVDKRREWTDCGGDLERVYTKDELLTIVTLYWVTGTIGTSFRWYYENRVNQWQPVHDRKPLVQAPTALAMHPEDTLMSRKWCESYYNLRRWTVMPAGGHFAPMEQPANLIADIRQFFRDFR